jgi:tRNA A37 threonylcarbamoyladenosine dehydratase
MEQFTRLIRLIGEDNYNKIKNSKVLVLGLGGVGGYAVISLIRSGIENITIVDYDTIDISNLNRQIITNVNNIGLKKTKVMEEEILKVNPNCHIKLIDKKLDEDNYDIIFKNNEIDYVIDACDTVKVKEKVISYCINNNIKIISCMGTGKKLNPSLLEITDIRNTSYDPLAKKIRKYVKDNKIKGKIPVVYSKEQPKDTGNVIGSFCSVVATAGMLCSSYVINDIINK